MTDFDKFIELIKSFGFTEVDYKSVNYILRPKEYAISTGFTTPEFTTIVKVVAFGDGGKNRLGYLTFGHGFGFDTETGKYITHGAWE